MDFIVSLFQKSFWDMEVIPPKPNGLGALEQLPEAVIRKIFEEFLSLQEKGCFLRVCSFSKRVLQQPWENVRKQYLLPVEAFGDRLKCEEILPMPKELLRVLDGEDGHLYVPVLKASWFRHIVDGKEKIFPATYKGIEKTSKLRGGLGYRYISLSILRQEESCKLQKMHWMLMTKDVLLGSRWLWYDLQVTFVQNWISKKPFLREGFEIPKDPRDAIYVILYQFCQDQIRLYSNHPWTYTCCQKKLVDGWRVSLGGFTCSGLSVIESYDPLNDDIGIGVLRKF